MSSGDDPSHIDDSIVALGEDRFKEQERANQSAKSVMPDGEEKYNDGCCATVAQSRVFDSGTLVVIVINAIWICVDVEWNHARLADADGKLPLEPGSIWIENLFCTYFFIEVVIRFIAFKRKIFCFKDLWFVFDSILVLFMVIETWLLPFFTWILGNKGGGGALSSLSSFRLLRLLRLTRMARVMRFFPELMTLVKGMYSAAQAVIFILAFLIIVMYVFAIVFTSQLAIPPPGFCVEEEGADDPTICYLFGSIGSSMMTLFTYGVLGDNLAQVLNIIKKESLFMMWLFIVFIVISSLTLLNMLIGVLCQVIDESSKEEYEARSINELKTCLFNAFQQVDESKDGKICEQEWEQIKHDPGLRKSLEVLGVEQTHMEERLNQMQETLFGHGESGGSRDGGLSRDEFANKVVELRWSTPASALDVAMLKSMVRAEDKVLKKQLDRIEKHLGRMKDHGGPAAPIASMNANPMLKGFSKMDQPKAEGGASWLEDVPMELLFHVLKTRSPPEPTLLLNS